MKDHLDFNDQLILAFANGLAAVEHLEVAADTVLRARAEKFIRGMEILQEVADEVTARKRLQQAELARTLGIEVENE